MWYLRPCKILQEVQVEFVFSFLFTSLHLVMAYLLVLLV